MNKKLILAVGSLIVLTIGIAAGVFYGVQRQQNIGSKAANGNKDGCSNTCSGNPPDCIGNTTNGSTCSVVTIATMPDTMNAWGFTHPTYQQPVTCTSRDSQKADCSCQTSTGTPYCWLPLQTLVRNVANQGHRWAMYVYDLNGNLVSGGPTSWVLYDDNPSKQDRWGNSIFWATESVVNCNERKEYREQADLYSPGSWVETGQVIYATATGPGCAASCESVTMTPDNATVTSTSTTRSLTAQGVGNGTLAYSWSTTCGSLSANSGQTVTWTAPNLDVNSFSCAVQATVSNSYGSSSPDICKKTLTYAPPGPPTCDSMAISPNDHVITASGQTRTLTASATANGNLTYNWVAEGGTISGSGLTVTWTAPTVGTTPQTWNVMATVTDSFGRTSSVGGCVASFTYTPPAAPTCASLTVDPNSLVITDSGQVRTLTANATGNGDLTYSWLASGGTISGSGQTVTWTAPIVGADSADWSITATVTDSLGRSTTGGCSTTFTYAPPGAPVCQSMEMVPSSTVVSTAGESRALTAAVTGNGTLTYTWTASGGTITGTGQTVTWTAPDTLPSSDQTYTISVTAADSLGRTSAVGSCTKTLTYSVIPSGVCQRVSADKSLSLIAVGDVVTFTGFGTVPVENPNTIDLINFTVLKDGAVDITQSVDAQADPDSTTATLKSYSASLQYTIGSAGSYTVVIKVHESGTPSTEWKI